MNACTRSSTPRRSAPIIIVARPSSRTRSTSFLRSVTSGTGQAARVEPTRRAARSSISFRCGRSHGTPPNCSASSSRAARPAQQLVGGALRPLARSPRWARRTAAARAPWGRGPRTRTGRARGPRGTRSPLRPRSPAHRRDPPQRTGSPRDPLRGGLEHGRQPGEVRVDQPARSTASAIGMCRGNEPVHAETRRSASSAGPCSCSTGPVAGGSSLATPRATVPARFQSITRSRLTNGQRALDFGRTGAPWRSRRAGLGAGTDGRRMGSK